MRQTPSVVLVNGYTGTGLRQRPSVFLVTYLIQPRHNDGVDGNAITDATVAVCMVKPHHLGPSTRVVPHKGRRNINCNPLQSEAAVGRMQAAQCGVLW